MTPIAALWAEGRLPVEDGVFFADGRSYAVVVDGTALAVVDDVDLAALLARDPDRLATIDITRRVPVADGGEVCAGEGSHGSEGFLARLAPDGALLWVCHLSESNPFDRIAVAGTEITARTTSGLTLTVPLDDPVAERP